MSSLDILGRIINDSCCPEVGEDAKTLASWQSPPEFLRGRVRQWKSHTNPIRLIGGFSRR